jgi:hypothetical protein
MTTYNGPATLLFDGAEYPVRAGLRYDASGRLPSWDGSITAQPDKPVDMWAIGNAGGSQRLRLPDGREGEFMVARFDMGGDALQIKGSGPAPF